MVAAKNPKDLHFFQFLNIFRGFAIFSALNFETTSIWYQVSYNLNMHRRDTVCNFVLKVSIHGESTTKTGIFL